MSHPLRNMMCESNIEGDHTDDECMDWAADEIISLRKELKMAKLYEAVCNCGGLASNHNFYDGHTSVPMIEQCPLFIFDGKTDRRKRKDTE